MNDSDTFFCMLHSILAAYGLQHDQCTIVPFGTGLINHTWKIESGNDAFILQRINDNVFKQPQDIASNINKLSGFLKKTHPDYLFVAAVPSLDGKDAVHDAQEGWFRLLPFIKNSFTYDVVSSTKAAYEAARQFGRFTRLLSCFDAAQLHNTLPHFHDLSLRYQQFEKAILEGNSARINQSNNSIKFLQEHKNIVDTYEVICSNNAFKKRVTHHDTKISNVLFDAADKGLCVIDLDTVMRGYFISDVGDMMRTYLSPVSEEDEDISKIEIREDYFKAIAAGYLSEMNAELTDEEKKAFVYAGTFMIYMQALRFLTDYLNNDVYYGARYEGHNLNRANNQINLLQKLLQKEAVLSKAVLADTANSV